MVDLAIAALVLLAAFAGWRKGFIAPLFAVAVSLLGLYAIYTGPAAGAVPTGATGIGLGVVFVGIASTFVMRIGGVLVGLVHRVSLLRAGDHVLGLPLGAVTGLVAVYLGLVAIVSFDNLLAPFHGKPTVDQATLDAMATQVAKSAIPADQIATFDQTLAFYESTVRPALVASVSAPMLLSVGEHLPFIGRHVEFPAK